MNFAEQLAYWYLRLNGFFPLSNFVRHAAHGGQSGDIDLVAVRLPHVYEEIGGQQGDFDPRLLEWGLRLDTDTIGMIAEVKSGGWPPGAIESASRYERLLMAVERIGLIPRQDAHAVATYLQAASLWREDDRAILKLFVSDRDIGPAPWHRLGLREAEEFIRRRMETHGFRKAADRMHFGDDLIQYLAWKGNQQ